MKDADGVDKLGSHILCIYHVTLACTLCLRLWLCCLKLAECVASFCSQMAVLSQCSHGEALQTQVLKLLQNLKVTADGMGARSTSSLPAGILMSYHSSSTVM